MSQMSLTASEVLQQAFNPSVAVIASQQVNSVCSKNRLTFVELLQPFSRLTVEGQIRDPNNLTHNVSQLRLSIRELAWKPYTAPVAKRLLGQAVSSCSSVENKTLVRKDSYDLNVTTQTPWYDVWRDTFWNCLELGDHDFSRHYLACLLVVSSAETDVLESFATLNNQLQQSIANGGNGTEAARWFSAHVLRFYVLVHDACDGDSAKAEDTFQKMRATYGTNTCHYLVINSKPIQNGSTSSEAVFPAPDPWFRFLPKKLSKADLSEEDGSLKGNFDAPETNFQELPSLVLEGDGLQGHKLPFVEAIQDAMKELSNSVLSPSASTVALSQMNSMEKNNSSNSLEVEDPLTSGARTESLEEQLARRTGVINSEKTASLEVHGACLTTDDVDRIQHLVNEFCLKALLPHAERQMKLLHESVLARKSTHRSLLNATKRWFGSGKPGSVSPYGSSAATAVSYHPESSQLQLRRLGDLAFLIGHYELAYWAYHTVKKEFEADQAWLHFASALEMAGYSAFMTGGKRPVPYHYFEKALTTYLHTCKMANFATRCAVLSSECFRATGMNNDAALQLIRLTSEDSDLRSALFLEQAALSFLRSAVKASLIPETAKADAAPLLRKFALNMILAGHRFGKAGQRKHASRAYQQALQVYQGRQWSLAEDHIYYTVGRQFLSGQQLEFACQALTNLFKVDSQQSPAQQAMFLREFVNVHQLLANQNGRQASEIPTFPLPIVDGNKIKVLVDVPEPVSSLPSGVTEASHVTFQDEEAHNSRWRDIEEKLVLTAQGSLPMTFRPTNVLFTETTNNSFQPVSYANELVSFEVPVRNQLQIPLALDNVRLLWTLNTDAGIVSNSSPLDQTHESHVTTYSITGLLVEPASTYKVVLHLRPLVSGELRIDGLAFELNAAAPNSSTPCRTAGKLLFAVQGPRLNSTITEKSGKVYGVDRRLSLLVLPSVPKLRVFLKNLPEFLLSGQVERVELQREDVRQTMPVGEIHVAVSQPQNAVLDLPCASKLKSGSTDPLIYVWDGEASAASLWIRGSDQPGLSSVDLMFYYGIPGKAKSYRLLRHACKIFVSPSLNLRGWSERIPLVHDTEKNVEDSLACYLEVKNQREVEDATLTTFTIHRVTAASEGWRLQPWRDEIHGTVLPRELRSQQSFVYTLRAVRCEDSAKTDTFNPHESGQEISRPFLDVLSWRMDDSSAGRLDLRSAVHWEAHQSSDDGSVRNVIRGLHIVNYPSLKATLKDKSDSAAPLLDTIVTYSLDYRVNNVHDFTRKKTCIVPVTLVVYNATDRAAVVSFAGNVDNMRNSQKTQIYMPEPAAPLRWVGRTSGKFSLGPRASTNIQLHVAVVRPGTFSLANGLEIHASLASAVDESVPVLQDMRLQYTLFVETP